MANNQQTLIPASDVQGNITSCKIENQLKSIQKNSALSLQQTSTYMTYDVCNRNTIAEYKIPELTGFSIFIGLAVVTIVAMIIVAISDSDGYFGW